MELTTIKITGSAGLATLEAHRALYPTTGEYPFLIGDATELEQIQQVGSFNERDFTEIIAASLNVNLDEWIAERLAEAEEYEFSTEELLGDWPGEVSEKGSISLHTDILTGEFKPEIYLGIAKLKDPWHLPAFLQYGAWNDCPPPEIHCAFHRQWQAEYGAEITGMSGDIIECVVRNPPRDRETAIKLAWQQYWYCADIVDQGCESINNLAATLVNSTYWYFWWD